MAVYRSCIGEVSDMYDGRWKRRRAACCSRCNGICVITASTDLAEITAGIDVSIVINALLPPAMIYLPSRPAQNLLIMHDISPIPIHQARTCE
jgi:hypothetical protein